jgi:arylsulfatase A-like enzyme
LIVLDTTRRDHLGTYGHTGNLTPNLDRFAADATVYDTAISPADWTAPSHASLFTGWYPATHGVSFAHHRWLDDRFQTLAEMLKGEGFQTVGLVANRYLHITNLHQGFDHYVLTWNDRGSYLGSAAQLLGFPRRWVDKGAHRSVEELARWMGTAYDPKRPLFLFVNLLEAHWRYLPPAAERTRTLPADVPYWQATRVSAGFHPIHWLGGQAHSGAGERAIRGLYAAEVSYQDQQLGRFLDELRGRIDFAHTLLIITADHGENLGEGARWDHVFAVNDHLVHVPLIIRYPGGAQAGQRIAGQCQTIDILPTIFAVLGREIPVHGLPGRTLLPDHFQPRTTTFSESVPFFDHSQRLSNVTGMRRDIARFTRVLRAARRDQFKYVTSDDGHEMLFDLASDPDEVTDVAAAHPDVVRDLRDDLLAWQRDLPPYAATKAAGAPDTPDEESPGLSEGERERLRQLGYMQ